MKTTTSLAVSRPPEPPPGAPWDAPFEQAPLAFFDLEMTGLDAARDRVIQICIERVVGGRCQDRLTSFVSPGDGGCGCPEARAVHQITPEDLLRAPSFAALAPRVAALLTGAVWIAHGAAHDLAFLVAEHRRLGVDWQPGSYLDTLRLARWALAAPGKSTGYGLAELAAALDIPNPRPHRADNDVLVLRQLWQRLVAILQPATPRDLLRLGAEGRCARAEVLAKAERARRTGRPVSVRYRPAGKAIEQLTFCVTGVHTDLDPPLVLGYLHDTRGRRQLCADRIYALDWADPSS